MRLFVTSKNRTDSLGNALGWHILSVRAIVNVKDLVPETDLQVLSLPVFDSSTKTPVDGYYLANCLRTIEALGYQPGTKRIYAHKVVIKDSCVPAETHMFLLKEQPLFLIISEQLWQRLSELEGISSIPVQTIP
jgi:hypothetical protein